MQISGLEKFRINSSIKDGVFVDVEALNKSFAQGLMMVGYEMPSLDYDDFKRKIEVRRKKDRIAMIVYNDVNFKVPKWWEDAEIIYSWVQPD